MPSPADRIARDRASGYGSRTWYFPDGDRPPHVTGPYEPHEALLIMNVADRPANVEIDVYWTDREPTIGLKLTVGAERVVSARVPWAETDADGQPFDIPARTQYAMRLRSDVPVVVQYGRLDMDPSFMLYTTMGLADPDDG